MSQIGTLVDPPVCFRKRLVSVLTLPLIKSLSRQRAVEQAWLLPRLGYGFSGGLVASRHYCSLAMGGLGQRQDGTSPEVAAEVQCPSGASSITHTTAQ